MKTRLALILWCIGWVVPAPSGALTVEEVLALKQNGISEETIQIMLKSEMQAQLRKRPDIGGSMGIKIIARPDGKSAIVYSTGGDERDGPNAQERLKEERAWDMLRHIIIDTRITDEQRPGPED